MQASWLVDERGRSAEAEREELGGRVSGPVDWRAKRDELGLQQITRPPVTGQSFRIMRTSAHAHVVMRQLHPGFIGVEVFGDAKVTSDVILLTGGSSQTSAVFCPTPVAQDKSFRCRVTFRMTAPPGSGEADGMAIVFASDKKLGLGGYGLGYSGLGGQGDFAVESGLTACISHVIVLTLNPVDTYRTRDYADDPPTPHISVHSPPDAHHRHSIACTPPDSLPYLSDGVSRVLDLFYDGTSRRLRGFLSGLEQKDDVEIGLFDVVIPKGGQHNWHVGVTGSCGGLWQKVGYPLCAGSI